MNGSSREVRYCRGALVEVISAFNMHRELVIVGNGPAAWAAAEEWVRLKAGRALVLAPHWPAVSAPSLSQLGNGRVAELAWKPEQAWPADVLAGRVEMVDAEAGALKWRNSWGIGARLTFDLLLLATGTRPRLLELEASDAPVLRLHEAADLKGWAKLRAGERLVVVGGGLVGAEMVEMGVARGCEVEWWVREHRIWPHVLSASSSQNLLHSTQRHGVEVKFNQELVAGQSIQADAVGLAIGTEPVLPAIHGTDLSRIFIAGDAAGKGSGWAFAGASGRATVRVMLGKEAEVLDARDFPFRASLFHDKICAWGRFAANELKRFAVGMGNVQVEWLESERGEFLGLVTLNFPIKEKWVEKSLAKKAFELQSLPDAVADPHLRPLAIRLSYLTPTTC